MRIETNVKVYTNQSVKYTNGIVVTYNNNHIAEVSDEVGEFLIGKYVGMIFEAGKAPKPGMVRSAPTKTDGGNAELKESLQKANRLVGDYKAQAQASKEGEQVWRNKCDDLMGEIKRLQILLAGKPAEVAPLEEVKELTEEEKIEADLAALRAKLEAKTVKELQAFAEELKLPKEEYAKLNKAKLVEYLVAKTNA